MSTKDTPPPNCRSPISINICSKKLSKDFVVRTDCRCMIYWPPPWQNYSQIPQANYSHQTDYDTPAAVLLNSPATKEVAIPQTQDDGRIFWRAQVRVYKHCLEAGLFQSVCIQEINPFLLVNLPLSICNCEFWGGHVTPQLKPTARLLASSMLYIH
jgi:hypothetical protein